MEARTLRKRGLKVNLICNQRKILNLLVKKISIGLVFDGHTLISINIKMIKTVLKIINQLVEFIFYNEVLSEDTNINLKRTC